MEKEFINFMIEQYEKELVKLKEKRETQFKDFKENKEKYIIEIIDMYKDDNFSDQEKMVKSEDVYNNVLKQFNNNEDTLSLQIKSIKAKLEEYENKNMGANKNMGKEYLVSYILYKKEVLSANTIIGGKPLGRDVVDIVKTFYSERLFALDKKHVIDKLENQIKEKYTDAFTRIIAITCLDED